MRIAQNRSPSYNVANLASLFTVCALAVDSVQNYSEKIRNSALQDIRHTLEWGAVLASEISEEVERIEPEEHGGAS